MMMVVLDRLNKVAIFIPCRSYITAKQTGKLLMRHVFSAHGFSVSMLSDRGLQFTVAWLQSLYGLIGTKQMLTTTYHPHTIGQTDRVNRTLTSPQAAGEPTVI